MLRCPPGSPNKHSQCANPTTNLPHTHLLKVPQHTLGRAKVYAVALRQQHQVVKHAKDAAAGLVDAANHCVARRGQVLERGNHLHRRKQQQQSLSAVNSQKAQLVFGGPSNTTEEEGINQHIQPPTQHNRLALPQWRPKHSAASTVCHMAQLWVHTSLHPRIKLPPCCTVLSVSF